MNSPQLAAQRVLDIYWKGQLPVDVVKIANAMGLSVMMMADPASGLSGAYDPKHPQTGGPTISISPADSRVRQRFTVAHELGHHVMHEGQQFRDPVHQTPGMEPPEVEANAFAAALLMPERIFKLTLNSIRYSTEDMCRLFNVSKSALGWRAHNLRG